MFDFDVKHFTKTFNSSPYYDGRINGFDIMVMQSHEDADKLIDELKKVIDKYRGLPQQEISIDYDDSNLLETDKIRVKREIQKYASQRLDGTRR